MFAFQNEHDVCWTVKIFLWLDYSIIICAVISSFFYDFNIGKRLLFVQGGSNRAASEDPTDWVLETSPWESGKCKGSETCDFPLRRLFPYGDSPVGREQNQMLPTTGSQVLQSSSSHSDPLVNTYFCVFIYWYFWKSLMKSVLSWYLKNVVFIDSIIVFRWICY